MHKVLTFLVGNISFNVDDPEAAECPSAEYAPVCGPGKDDSGLTMSFRAIKKFWK